VTFLSANRSARASAYHDEQYIGPGLLQFGHCFQYPPACIGCGKDQSDCGITISDPDILKRRDHQTAPQAAAIKA
jgi:hypothetical protein